MHRRFTLVTDIRVYLGDPHHPWQCRTNENTDDLLRQYFPTGISMANVSQAKLDAVARRLNERPRKATKHRQSDIDKLLRRSVEPKVESGHLRRWISKEPLLHHFQRNQCQPENQQHQP